MSPEYAIGFVNREPDEKLITEEKIWNTLCNLIFNKNIERKKIPVHQEIVANAYLNNFFWKNKNKSKAGKIFKEIARARNIDEIRNLWLKK